MRHSVYCTTLALLLACTIQPASAHHSYADYERNERNEFRGTLTSIHWGNPHILLNIHSDREDMRIEWITVTGADLTRVSKEQFVVGDEVVVIASRNRNPDQHIMTLVKELRLPAKQWQWISPTVYETTK